jgi:hypothetical protein
VFTCLNMRRSGSYFPLFLSLFLRTWWVFETLLGQIGELGATPCAFNLFSNIIFASCLRKSSIGSAGAFLARARAIPALTSATDKRKVN